MRQPSILHVNSKFLCVLSPSIGPVPCLFTNFEQRPEEVSIMANAGIKGDEIRFIAGKYSGKTGWINTSEVADDRVTPVIVDLGARRGEKETFVFTGSFKRNENKPPTTYAEAVLQQCPDIERDFVMVSRKLAKCGLERDVVGFQKELTELMNDAVKWQREQGSKASYRKIYFQEPQIDIDIEKEIVTSKPKVEKV